MRATICFERRNSWSIQACGRGVEEVEVLEEVQLPWIFPKRFQERKAGPEKKVAMSD